MNRYSRISRIQTLALNRKVRRIKTWAALHGLVFVL
jgi:hypothetical protein